MNPERSSNALRNTMAFCKTSNFILIAVP